MCNEIDGGPLHSASRLLSSRPQIHDLQMCVYFGAVDQVYIYSDDGCLSSSILFKY